MRHAAVLAFSVYSTVFATVGCKSAKLTTGSAAPSAETAAPTPNLVFTFAIPDGQAALAPVGLELLRDFNTGLGQDLLIVPLPIVKPTSTWSWTTIGFTTAASSPSAASDCTGAAIAGSTPALAITMDITAATNALPSLGHLDQAPLYAAFAKCVGLGLGLTATTSSGDVMGPDPTKSKDFAAFYTAVMHVVAPLSVAPNLSVTGT